MLVRFRNGDGEEDIEPQQSRKISTLSMIQGLDSQGATEFLGDAVLVVAKRTTVQSDPSDTDYQNVLSGIHSTPVPFLATKNQFLKRLRTTRRAHNVPAHTSDGLYLIRQPALEAEFRTREQQMTRHTP